MSRCDLSPAAAATPLSSDDVEWLLANDVRELLRPSGAARTLVMRVRATVGDADERIRVMRTDVVRMAEEYKMKSSPLSAAVLALSRLPADDHDRVFSAYATGVLETLREELTQARSQRLAAEAAARRVQLAVAEVLSDPTLPATVRVKLEKAAEKVEPARVPVDVPDLNVGDVPFVVEPASEDDSEDLSGLFT